MVKQQPVVLVVDDDPTVAEVIGQQLRHILVELTLGGSYRVEIFTDPTEALVYAKEHQCCLLITDYDMPGMNGIQLTLGVPELAVIVLSSQIFDADVQYKLEELRKRRQRSAATVGAFALPIIALEKPQRLLQLREAVKVALAID